MSFGPVQPVPVAIDADVVAAFEAHHRELLRFATSYAGRDSDAEDIVQEGFARLVRESRLRRMPADPRAWLYAVVANLARSRARRSAVADRARRLLALAAPPRRPDEEVERRADFDALRRVVATLPAERREAFLLAVDGFSGAEIAAIMGRTPNAVRQLIWRARETIRAELGEVAR